MRALVRLGLFVALLGAPAAARVEAQSEYTKAQTFSGALRYLRVDLGYEVTEKDDAAAYLLFKYPTIGKRDASSQGSIEVIEAGSAVRVFVQMPQAPEYQERMLRDGLLRKLQQEYGAPPPKPPAQPKTPEKPPASKPDK
jgi:hypothetical protein